MAKTLSIEQKAELYDKILATMKSYYSKLDDDLEKKKPKKEIIPKGTIPFSSFIDVYPRKEAIPAAAKQWKSLSDEDRKKAIDYAPIYYKEKYTPKDWIQYIVYPVKYLMNRYRENSISIDYTDLKVFDEMKRLWKDETLKNSLWDKYLEVFRKWKDSEYYLK